MARSQPFSALDAPARVGEGDRAQVKVQVSAPARLHLGFLDPAGTLGRRYGSLGLVIEGYDTRVELSAAERDRIDAHAARGEFAASAAPAPEIARACAIVRALRQRTGRDDPLALRLEGLPPAHAGFGSGTQLALAIGRAFARWQRIDVPTAELARWLGRGQRSGVGIAGFEQGGLLVDGGPGDEGAPAPLLSRIAFPEGWRIVLVQDHRQSGLAGAAERRALAELPALPQGVAADICHEVLMRILPGAADAAFATFAAGLTRVQQLLGVHFAPAQDGSAYTSAAVGRAVDSIGTACAAAVGQSSWGPTGFAIVPSQADAEAAVRAAHSAQASDPALQVSIVRARNGGAQVSEST